MKIGIAVRRNDTDYFVHRSYINLLNEYDYGIITKESNLAEYDGFLIPGGYDIDSKYYNESIISCHNIDNEIDELDKKIVAYALKSNKPLLGICRGLQSINVFLGGSLKQDIINHNNENHFIIFNNKHYLVNSFHHQSVKNLGKNIKVLAKSLDDEIEIISFKSIIGVQFHQEISPTKINKLILKVFNDI